MRRRRRSAGRDRATGRTHRTRVPAAIVERFYRLDGDGGQLTSRGWDEIAAMFVQPGPASHSRSISVIRDKYGVSRAAVTDGLRSG